jgi:hypothetical protein
LKALTNLILGIYYKVRHFRNQFMDIKVFLVFLV